jgi:hypothetical protein
MSLPSALIVSFSQLALIIREWHSRVWHLMTDPFVIKLGYLGAQGFSQGRAPRW